MPGDINECLEHAKNCLRLAAEARRPSDKQHFEALAARWMAIAKDLQATKVLLAAWGDVNSELPD